MSWRLYKNLPGFVLGFHGCDQTVGEKILLNKDHVSESRNKWDWLGAGMYFWEGSPERAMQFAQQAQKEPQITRGKITKPFVVGAVIDLGRCLNLLDASGLDEVDEAYTLTLALFNTQNKSLPENKGDDLRQRYLDQTVIETLHRTRARFDLPSYQTVRAAFWEGERLYPNAGFAKRNHIQIAVCDPECIKGYFRPIEK